jgi:hypothetical protein
MVLHKSFVADNNPLAKKCLYWKFDGPRQRDTPVGPFDEFLVRCSQLPGAAGKALRTEQADITARVLSGDIALIVDILDVNDTRTGSRSLTTITSAAAADEITDLELQEAHGADATQHAGLSRVHETSCRAAKVTRCSGTGDVLVSSEWLVKTGAIDRLWDTMCDIAHTVHENLILGDSRNVYFIRQVGSRLVKIGFARHPLKRLLTLQCGNCWQLKIEYLVPTEHFVRLEQAIHDYLKQQGCHVRGEWFSLPDDVCHEDIVQSACDPMAH